MAFVYRCQATSPCIILELSIFNIVCLKINILNIRITCFSSFPHPSALGMRCLFRTFRCVSALNSSLNATLPKTLTYCENTQINCYWSLQTLKYQRFSDCFHAHHFVIQVHILVKQKVIQKKGLCLTAVAVYLYIYTSDIQNKLKHVSCLFLLFSCYSQHFYFYSFHSCP